MQISVNAPLDLGVTFGISDDVFTPSIVRRILRSIEKSIGESASVRLALPSRSSDDEADIPYGTYSPLGRGLRIEVTGESNIARVWRDEAAQVARRVPDISTEFSDAAIAALEKMPIASLQIDIYPLGVALIHLRTGEADLALTGAAVAACLAFEHALYGDIEFAIETNRRLRELFNALIESAPRAPAFAFARRSFDLPVRPRQLFIRAVSRIVVLDEDEEEVWLRLRAARPHATVIESPTVDVDYDWGTAILRRKMEGASVAQILWVLTRSDAMFELIAAFQSLVASRVRSELQHVVSGGDASGKEELRRLRFLIEAALAATDAQGLTLVAEAIRFNEEYERFSKVSEKKQHLRQAADVLLQLEHREADRRQQRRNELLVTLGLMFTGVSLCGVVAAIIQVFAQLNYVASSGESLRMIGWLEIAAYLAAPIALVLLGAVVFIVSHAAARARRILNKRSW